jgi:hypothetical protein
VSEKDLSNVAEGLHVHFKNVIEGMTGLVNFCFKVGNFVRFEGLVDYFCVCRSVTIHFPFQCSIRQGHSFLLPIIICHEVFREVFEENFLYILLVAYQPAVLSIKRIL